MGASRKFSWEKAKRLYQDGATKAEIARRLGVSWAAVHMALDPEARKRMRGIHAEWQMSSECPDCGVQTTRQRVGQDRRCWSCSAKLKATTVRETALRCTTCRRWKPDDAFPHDRRRIARRQRHRQCTSCQTVAKREWRDRNREHVTTYEREYNRKRRTA